MVHDFCHPGAAEQERAEQVATTLYLLIDKKHQVSDLDLLLWT